uniref:Uncharacterized protein n=1 Tax=Romanomermis culicivorax TaxID=13658 RepID=A0A915L7V9_ROMCU
MANKSGPQTNWQANARNYSNQRPTRTDTRGIVTIFAAGLVCVSLILIILVFVVMCTVHSTPELFLNAVPTDQYKKMPTRKYLYIGCAFSPLTSNFP